MKRSEPLSSPIEAPYGSDRSGLVWAYRFGPEGTATPVSLESTTREDIQSMLETPSTFLWIHASLANNAAAPWMRQTLDLPDAFHESLHEETGSMRLEQDGEALVAVVHDVLFDFAFDASSISTAVLCVGPRLLVTARLKPLRSLDRLREAVRTGSAFRSPADLLAQLLQYQAQGLVDITRQATRRVDEIEDGILENRLSRSRGDLGSLRRVLVRLQRLLAPEPASLFRLLGRPPNWMPPVDLQPLRESAEEFSAAVADSAALVERIRLLQEEVAALGNEQTNRTLFVLTVVTVLALPVNMVAGLLGMNVGGIPFATSREGFAIVTIALVATTAILAWLSLGRRRGD